MFEQARNVVCNPFTFRLGKLSGRCHMSAGRQVIPQHVRLDTPNCGDGSARLVDDVEAGPFLANHLLKPSDLAFNPAQPRQLPAVIGQRIRRLCAPSAPHVLKTAYVDFRFTWFAKANYTRPAQLARNSVTAQARWRSTLCAPGCVSGTAGMTQYS